MSTSLYANLVQEITTILDVIHETEAGVTTQLKKDLVQASNAFKDDMNKAKESAAGLQGGDLSVTEQEEVSAMLRELISRKKRILRKFANDINAPPSTDSEVKMEVDVDSTASTPAN